MSSSSPASPTDSTVVSVDMPRQANQQVSMEIEFDRDRFPFSVVWTPIPVLTWFFPFIGHLGKCISMYEFYLIKSMLFLDATLLN